MSKILLILAGLLAFALLCYLCITRHVPEFLGAATVPAVNTNINRATPAPVSSATPLTTTQAATQTQVNTQIAGKIVEFATGSDQLTDKGKAVLDELVPIFKTNADTNFEVGGHTDNKGNAAANLSLSERRAVTVKKYLASKGLAETRFTTKGYGDTQPVASNDTEDGRQKNRRIGFNVTGGGK